MPDDPTKNNPQGGEGENKNPQGNPNPQGDGAGAGAGEGDGAGSESPMKALMEEKGFKTEKEAADYIRDIETKSKTTAEERDTYQRYYPYALAFSSYLKSNPKAMEDYKKWSDGQGGDEGDGQGEDKNKKDNTKTEDEGARKDISALLNLEKEKIINSFDQKYGFTSMKDEEYKRIAGAIGTTIADWGIDLVHPTTEMLNKLPKALEDAYSLIRIQQARKDGKAEGLVEADQNNKGRIPFIPSGSIENPDEITEGSLTSQEKEAAAKMKLTPKEYAEQKKAIATASKK